MKQVECSQLKLKTSNKITNGDRLAKTLREASLYLSYGGPPPPHPGKNYSEISGSCALQRNAHTLHIWLTTENKLRGISPFQMRKFLILFMALST